jgi:hypothetical protein
MVMEAVEFITLRSIDVNRTQAYSFTLFDNFYDWVNI